ncbi:MAG: hypothetical protein WC749_02365 [Dehalococcoidia bacterium]
MPIVSGINIPASSQMGPLAVVTWPSTVDHTLVATTVAQTLVNKTLGAGTIESLETATSDSALVNYGVSLLPYSTDAQTVTLAAPLAGVRKTLVLYSTSAVPDSTEIYTLVDCSTNVQVLYNSTALVTKNTIKFSVPYTAVELIGITTALWGVVSYVGATGSTLAFSS